MKHWMFSCKEVTKKVSAAMEEPLSLGEKLFMWMHFLMCRYCLRFYRHLHLMRRFCRQNELPHEDARITLSPQAARRMKTAIKECIEK